jgi:hypothetical protein
MASSRASCSSSAMRLASPSRPWRWLGMAFRDTRPSVIPMMTITTITSTSVKPAARCGRDAINNP